METSGFLMAEGFSSYFLHSFSLVTIKSSDFPFKIQLCFILDSCGWWTSGSCIVCNLLLSTSPPHLSHTPIIYNVHSRRHVPHSRFFFHGYIIGWSWMRHCQNPWAVSPVELWDDSRLSPVAKSSLMSHFPADKMNFLHHLWKNSLYLVEHLLEISKSFQVCH